MRQSSRVKRSDLALYQRRQRPQPPVQLPVHLEKVKLQKVQYLLQKVQLHPSRKFSKVCETTEI
jgi:hypothetical protein